MKRTEHTQKWLDALRSGEYKQNRGFIASYSDSPRAYCCVGVACVVLGLDVNQLPYAEAREAMGYSTEEFSCLVRMNDKERKTFPEIADAIEQMLDGN